MKLTDAQRRALAALSDGDHLLMFSRVWLRGVPTKIALGTLDSLVRRELVGDRFGRLYLTDLGREVLADA